VPGGAVHLDGEQHLLVGGVHDEAPTADAHGPLLHERRHAGPAQHLEAAPDLQLALASVREQSGQVDQLAAPGQPRPPGHLEAEVRGRAEALPDGGDRAGSGQCGPGAPAVDHRAFDAGHRDPADPPGGLGQVRSPVQDDAR
jgi:hypothetical protein